MASLARDISLCLANASVPMAKVLAEQKIALDTGDYLKLLPHKHQTDGFFAAVLERKPMAPKPPKADAAEGEGEAESEE